jgi:hypothetical protein
MAKKAKQKAVNKHEKSYANAAKGVKTPSVFAKTTCVLKMPPAYPNRRIPTTKEKNSFFLDLKATDASDKEVAEALTTMENVCGVSYRDDLRTVEVIFTNINARNDNAKKQIVIEGKKPLFPMLPREQQPNILYVRLANLPYGEEEDIRREICGHWEEYGEILDVAPHKVYNKWLTRCWDLLIVIPNGKKLEAPVAFDILDRPVVAAWPSSPPSCLICNSAGHQAKKCPKKNPKAGGASDPVNKVGQTSKASTSQKQPKDVTQGATEESRGNLETQSADKGKIPEDRQPGTTTHEMIGIESTPSSSAAADHMEEDEETVDRAVTPPDQLISTVKDPDTPRKGAKRMSKVEMDKVLPPSANPDFDPVRQFMIENFLCGACGDDHRGRKCIAVGRTNEEVMKRVLKWQDKARGVVFNKTLSRRESKRIAALNASNKKEMTTVTARGTNVFAGIPAFCVKCRQSGHTTTACPLADCNHCGSKAHVGANCPTRQKYAFEK